MLLEIITIISNSNGNNDDGDDGRGGSNGGGIGGHVEKSYCLLLQIIWSFILGWLCVIVGSNDERNPSTLC